MNIVETRSLVKRFGGLVASDHIDFAIRQGELRCLIGPNGAGKTTFFNLLSGQLAPDEGRIVFQGKDVTSVPLYLRSRQGMGRKYQSPSLFDDLTVADNIRVSSRGKCSPFSLLSRRQDAADEEIVESMLRTVHLEQKRNLAASQLAHGERQWLEIAMVLANKPTLLLLDEPTAGMTPAETRETAQLLKEITRNISAIVIEHDLKFVREIASQITVLHKGAVLTEGSIDEIAADREVRRVYLGRETL